MRKLKSLLLVAFLALGMSGVANAQKIGHVNLERVVANMPETRALQAEIEKISKTYKDEIDGMGKKFEAKYKKYSAEQNTQTEEVNKQRAEEIQGDRNRIVQAEQAAVQDIQQKQQSKLIPILQKAEKAIKDICKAKGLLYILDSSAGKGVLVADGTDIYNDLKTKLGLLPDQKQPQTTAKK
ncbi:OmpH family outer membrane protein [Pseudotenacibaculum sp. MALMAid0570]|uniref:OmpH family outer membrane protein n=1 Tax=Pseudotenacibaculum sp. MALMAid0570 TaxID=3143938 RepID=UPI0032DE7F31